MARDFVPHLDLRKRFSCMLRIPVILCIFLLASLYSIMAYGEESSLPFPQADLGAELRQGSTLQVLQVIDPLRLQLADKTIIQLAGIEIPDLKPYEAGDISVAALGFLKEFLEGKKVRIYQTRDRDKGRINRLGYQLAHIVRQEDETWIQGTLLQKGLARILPTQGNPEMAAQMLALEAEARAEKRGLWENASYAVLTPETAADAPQGWVIVEGTPQKISTINNRVYLNFGANWRTDFTIGIDSAIRRQLSHQGIDVLSLTGHPLRIRGWLESYNGPYINLIHPAWLEILPQDETSQTEGSAAGDLPNDALPKP